MKDLRPERTPVTAPSEESPLMTPEEKPLMTDEIRDEDFADCPVIAPREEPGFLKVPDLPQDPVPSVSPSPSGTPDLRKSFYLEAYRNADKSGVIPCQVCGAPALPFMRYCPMCGRELLPAGPAAVPRAPEDPRMRKARFLHRLMTAQLLMILAIPAGLLTALVFAVINAGSVLHAALVMLVNKLVGPLLSLALGMDFNSGALNQLQGQYLSLISEYGDKAVFWAETMVAAPFMVFLAFAFAAAVISFGARGLFSAGDFPRTRRMLRRCFGAGLLGALASGLAVFLIYRFWSFPLLLLSLNVSLLAAVWLSLRFFTIKGVLKRASRGLSPPERAGVWYLWAGMGSLLICLLGLDCMALAFLL